MELGKVGAFVFMDAMSAQESIAFCQRVEKLGYKVVWSPEAWGREPFAHGSYLLANTDGLIYATGIANIWFRDPVTMQQFSFCCCQLESGGISTSRPSSIKSSKAPQLAKHR